MIVGYDYSTREARERTVSELFARAKKERNPVEMEWEMYERMYSFQRNATTELEEDDEWKAPVMPDPWIQVESGVNTTIPEPEFRGRDGDMDSAKAKQREYVVRYILENNHVKEKTVEQDKRTIKLGDAFFKAYWDSSMRCGKDEGDIRVTDIAPKNIYPDPTIKDAELDDCEYIDYCYTVHKAAFARLYAKEMKKAGLKLEDLLGERYTHRTDNTTKDDSVEVLEHWFKQPEDGKDTHAGCIACSVQVAGHELKYIPNYWKNTWRQNSKYPFVHLWRIKNENSFWNFSELFPIADMLYAADRKLAMATLGDSLMSNDIIIMEEGALAEGEEITNEPGQVLKTKPGKSGSIRRLGGVQSLANSAVDLQWYTNQLERTTRNYETSRGKEAQRTTTATGMAMLRADADKQVQIKNEDRNHGYERLYRLLDLLALEFFDDGRLIFLGEDKAEGREAMSFEFDSRELSSTMPEILDAEGNVVREEFQYWPEVDVTITATDAVLTGANQTLQVLDKLAERQVTADNYEVIIAMLDMLKIPQRQDIIKNWRAKFEAPQMPQMSAGMGAGMGAGADLAGLNTPESGANVPETINGVPTNV